MCVHLSTNDVDILCLVCTDSISVVEERQDQIQHCPNYRRPFARHHRQLRQGQVRKYPPSSVSYKFPTRKTCLPIHSLEISSLCIFTLRCVILVLIFVVVVVLIFLVSNIFLSLCILPSVVLTQKAKNLW